MNKLEERLSHGLKEVASLIPEEEGNDVVARPERRKQSGILVSGLAMLAVLAAIGGATWLVSGSSSDPASGGAFYPVPGHLPESADTVWASYALTDPNDPRVVSSVIARISEGGFDDAVLVSVVDSDDTTGRATGEPTSVKGHDAFLVDDESGVSLWWLESGRTVVVHATNGDRNLAEVVADSLTVRDGDFDGSLLTMGELPVGFDVLAQPKLQSAEPMPVVSTIEQGSVGTEGPDRMDIVLEPYGLFHAVRGVESAVYSEFDGKRAVEFGDEAVGGLAWELTPGLTIVISGTYSIDELRLVASGIDFVTESEWLHRYEIGSTDLDLPSTTISPTS